MSRSINSLTLTVALAGSLWSTGCERAPDESDDAAPPAEPPFAVVQEQRAFTPDELGTGRRMLLMPECMGWPKAEDNEQHASPLYHDCQEVISSAGDAYQTLIAVAIDNDQPLLKNASFSSLPTGKVRRVAYLVNKGTANSYSFGKPGAGQDYVLPKSSIHCVYVGPTNPKNLKAKWHAMIVAEPACKPHDPATAVIDRQNNLPGSFHVQRDTPYTQFDAYPAAAVLDWSETGNGVDIDRRQAIGVRCGSGWCTVSAHGNSRLRPVPNPGNGSKRLVRGWHDQQVLAVSDAGALKPNAGKVIAWIMPIDTLESIVDFSSPREVASVHLSGFVQKYKDKFNFDVDSTGQNENVIKIGIENGTWFAAITSASRDTTRRFKVKRRGNLPDPQGSARWGWLPNDEGAWVRCGGACCEITDVPF